MLDRSIWKAWPGPKEGIASRSAIEVVDGKRGRENKRKGRTYGRNRQKIKPGHSLFSQR
jgi:hypothetical protein